MTKKDFKKQFPDVAKQEITFLRVESRSSVEKTVIDLVKGLKTGLLGYTYSGKKLNVFTSEIFKTQLNKMIKGTSVVDKNTQQEGTITSDEPFICSSEMCIRVDFGKGSDVYACSYFKL